MTKCEAYFKVRSLPACEWFVENLINALSDGDCVDDDLIKLLLDCHKKSIGGDGNVDADLLNTMMILSIYKKLNTKV